ncbi:hypothetical protein [Pusillimonas sp. NJUB218]|uniref:hypothetical protein n=1 Tax=Pusillimonas sp. NJUB218 TaxID=2023230 RepID=UPI000F4B7BF0|nr:hypothetical protein [Pusillimonas sp. NJUB218]ROT44209.1 hypothetical protein CHR62_12805 [Pusillimonas sp. NJUB218]
MIRLPTQARGQALAEGVVVLVVLCGLWAASTWLFRLQDMALQVLHASRSVAFAATRGGSLSAAADLVRERYFSGPSHQWRTRAGESWLRSGRPELSVDIGTLPALSPYAQPGAGAHGAAVLASSLGVGDSLLTEAVVRLQPRALDTGAAPLLVGRQSILVGAGHAIDDADVVQRVGSSAAAWSVATASSVSTGQALASVLEPLDRGWSRAVPDLDWLSPWHADVPAWHLKPSGGSPG